MPDTRRLEVTQDRSVREFPTRKPPLDWSWVGSNDDLAALYEKLENGGWKVITLKGERAFNVVRIGAAAAS